MVSAETITWMHDYVGECDHPAVTKAFFLRYDDLSTIQARLANTFYNVVSKLIYYWEVTRPSEAIVREVLGEDVPSLATLRYNVSLVMMNSHPSIFGVRPTVPRALHVAGIHLQPADPKTVPQVRTLGYLRGCSSSGVPSLFAQSRRARCYIQPNLSSPIPT